MVDVLGRTVLELAIEGLDSTEAGLDSIKAKAQDASQEFDKGFAIAAAGAMVAAGAAIEGFNRKQQEATVNTRQLAARLGENEDAVRGWATEMSDAGFALDEAVALMDLASRRGLEGQGPLQEYARFWDQVADASGESAVALGEAGVGLQGIGIAAGQEGEAVDALGFIMDNTTSSIGEFLQFVERTGPELRTLGADVNDAAAIMGILENELGLTGRVARTEFRQAINDSDGTLQGMLDTLGITTEQFEAARGSVVGAGEAVERNAEIFNEALTPLQQVQAAIGDFMYENAALVEGLGGLAAILAGGGPLLLGITGLIQIAPLLGGAFSVMLGPIGAVTAALGLLAAGFATDFLGMRTRLERDLADAGRAIDNFAMDFGDMGDTVHRLADEAGVDFQTMKERIQAEMAETGDSFEQVVRRIQSGYTAMTESQWDTVEEAGNAWAEHRNIISDAMFATETETAEGVAGIAAEIGTIPEKGADELLANQFHLTDAATQLTNFVDQALSPMEEKAQARAFLASDALGNALGSPNPLVRQKAAELQQQALDVLNDTSGFYAGGESSGLAWAYGAGSHRVLSAAFGAGVTVAASFGMSTRGMSPPKAGPLQHLDDDAERVGMAWINGIRRIIGEAFSVGADLAGGLARGLVPDLSMPSLSVPSLPMAPAMAGIGSIAAPTAAGGGRTEIYQLYVNGVPRVVGDREDVLDGWDTLKRSAR